MVSEKMDFMRKSLMPQLRVSLMNKPVLFCYCKCGTTGMDLGGYRVVLSENVKRIRVRKTEGFNRITF